MFEEINICIFSDNGAVSAPSKLNVVITRQKKDHFVFYSQFNLAVWNYLRHHVLFTPVTSEPSTSTSTSELLRDHQLRFKGRLKPSPCDFEI